VLDFIKGAYIEFRKVEWPSFRQTVRLTVLVVGVSLAVGLFVMGVDYLFKEGLSLIIK